MRLATFLAVFVGLAGAALADDGVSSADLLDYAQWGAAIAAIASATQFTRGIYIFADALSPSPSTLKSRSLSRLVALGWGLVAGLVGIAPMVSVSGGVLAGKLTAGLIAAGLTVFGRDGIVKLGVRPVQKRKAAKLAGMTTGQFRAHRAEEQAEDEA